MTPLLDLDSNKATLVCPLVHSHHTLIPIRISHSKKGYSSTYLIKVKRQDHTCV